MIQIKDIFPDFPESLNELIQKGVNHLVSNGTDEFTATHVTVDYYLDKFGVSEDKIKVAGSTVVFYFAWREVKSR